MQKILMVTTPSLTNQKQNDTESDDSVDNNDYNIESYSQTCEHIDVEEITKVMGSNEVTDNA